MGRTDLAKRGINPNDLSDRHRRFVAEYCVDYNATRAAKIAGYKNPGVMGRRMLDPKHYPNIARAIGAIQQKDLEAAVITKDQILEELSTFAMRDVLDMCDEDGIMIVDDLRKVPAKIRRCIDDIQVTNKYNKVGDLISQTYKIRFASKLGAIDMLAKYYGLFAPDKLEVKHAVDWDSLYNESEEDQTNIVQGAINARLEVEQPPKLPKKVKKTHGQKTKKKTKPS